MSYKGSIHQSGAENSNLEYDYNVELESKVDYSHAAHAKLSTFMKKVKEKLINKEK